MLRRTEARHGAPTACCRRTSRKTPAPDTRSISTEIDNPAPGEIRGFEKRAGLILLVLFGCMAGVGFWMACQTRLALIDDVKAATDLDVFSVPAFIAFCRSNFLAADLTRYRWT